MRLLFPLLVLALLAAPPAEAQRTPPPPPPPGDAGESTQARFRLADQYMQAEQYERAIAVLEDLLARSPGLVPVVERLKNAYVAAERPEEAIALLHRHLTQSGPTPQLLAELAGLYMGQGDVEAARDAWRQAVDAAPDHVNTYRVIYSSLVRNRMWEKARDILLEGRSRLGQPSLFRIELAELYSRSNQHAEALEEWAALIADEPERMSFVQGRLGRMLDQEGAGPTFREALDRLIRREPTRLPLRRLAAWLAAETGDFATGLDHTRAIDRLGQERGESLLAYAEAALQADAYEVAGRALELVLELHPQGPSAAAALLASGLLHEKIAARANERRHAANGEAPHYRRAREHYARFLEDFAAHAAAPAAMHRLALLHRDVFRDYDRARQLLERITEVASGQSHALDAQFALGELALLEDDLSGARIAFTRLDNQLRTGDRAERARFELARLDFYEGNFEMALSRVNAMKRNTSTDVANNAIDLKLILTENKGPDPLATPLRSFARAELRARQYRHKEALDELEEILSAFAGHPVEPLARFRRAENLRALGRPDAALAALSDLPERFPESYLADRALFLVGEVHERDLQDPAAAMDAYTRLLTRYPGSLLAPEARTRIRRLRGDLPS